jgi:phage tail sheath protein FI
VPEYLAPGVYVQEVSFQTSAIQGVSTTTTGFIGPTRVGPTEGPLQVLTSLSDFEQIYGDGQPLDFGADGQLTNFMWQAARAFFEQGGVLLYVQRVFTPRADGEDGKATATIPPASAGSTPLSLGVTARWPGAAMSGTPVTISLQLGPNVLSLDSRGKQIVNGLSNRDVVWVNPDPPTPGSPPSAAELYLVSTDPTGTVVSFESPTQSPTMSGESLSQLGLTPQYDPKKSSQIRVVTATVTVQPTTPGALPQVWSGLPLDPSHTTYGAKDSIFDMFTSATNADTVVRPIVIEPLGSPPSAVTGLDVVDALHAGAIAAGGSPPELDPGATTTPSLPVTLDGGSDGKRPVFAQYEGDSADPDDKSGLNGFKDIDGIAIVAAPGSTFDYENGWRLQAATIMNLLIEHCESVRYRVAVLDCGDKQTMPNVEAQRAIVDSKYAALYYPWIKILDPITNSPLTLPPSGFVAGIYARNDIERGVYKAPANEPVLGALGFEKNINRGQQEVLNPIGINCFRFFEDRGFRLWGARTISSDPQWKYVNIRRYFVYLEHSLDNGTQWVVFEPNGPRLWESVRNSVADFLLTEWRSGALAGDKPSQAYFVKCDLTTMTQDDIQNGRLVCQVGVAPLYPAEFVIFQIGQWTANAGQSQ